MAAVIGKIKSIRETDKLVKAEQEVKDKLANKHTSKLKSFYKELGKEIDNNYSNYRDVIIAKQPQIDSLLSNIYQDNAKFFGTKIERKLKDGNLVKDKEIFTTAKKAKEEAMNVEFVRLQNKYSKSITNTNLKVLNNANDYANKRVEATISALQKEKEGLEIASEIARVDSQLASIISKKSDIVKKETILKFNKTNISRALTIAQMETQRASQLSASIEATEFVKNGVVNRVLKSWNAVLDNVTRETHAEAESDYGNNPIPIDEPFIVDGEELDYPGDESGSPENTINCRCSMVEIIDV